MTSLDMTGKPCPIPVIEAKKALNVAAPGDIVSVLVDNDISRQNLQKMARGLGHEFSYEQRADGNFQITITAAEVSCRPDEDEGGLMVSIGRDYLGGANEELGRALMKSFIYSLVELDTPPELILFYNGGVLLTTEGSAVLDDLRTLEGKGSQIVSCGLCLNYFKLTDQLAIGRVTNMYAATLAMAHAKKLITL